MKAKEIKQGGTYSARVNGNLTTVRVDSIREVRAGLHSRIATHFDVTNLATRRETMFRSASKFLSEVR